MRVNAFARACLALGAHLDTTTGVRPSSAAPIANEPAELRTERTVRVTTQPDNADLLLKPEMTGHAKIYCGERRLIDLITRRFIRFLKVEFWSWW